MFDGKVIFFLQEKIKSSCQVEHVWRQARSELALRETELQQKVEEVGSGSR